MKDTVGCMIELQKATAVCSSEMISQMIRMSDWYGLDAGGRRCTEELLSFTALTNVQQIQIPKQWSAQWF
jgi:hypothetical protein